jgi:hypothetical protein
MRHSGVFLDADRPIEPESLLDANANVERVVRLLGGRDAVKRLKGTQIEARTRPSLTPSVRHRIAVGQVRDQMSAMPTGGEIPTSTAPEADGMGSTPAVSPASSSYVMHLEQSRIPHRGGPGLLNVKKGLERERQSRDALAELLGRLVLSTDPLIARASPRRRVTDARSRPKGS